MAKIKITKKQFEDLNSKQNITKENGVDEEESSEKKKLKEKIDSIDEEYENSPVRTYGDVEIPNVNEKTYEMPSQEETAKKASEEISPLYNAKLNSLTSENQMKKNNIENEKDELYERAEDSLKELKKSYDSAKNDAGNEAIKRGLARSSIILNQLSDLEQSRIGATGSILGQRDKGLSELSRQIDQLKAQLLNDANILNEERAKEINQRVEELFEKYEQEQREVDEYNEKIKNERAETLAKLKESGIDIDETKTKEYIKMYANKIKAFYSYYYSFGDKAFEEMQKDRKYIEEHVGEKGFESLSRYFT